MSGGGERRRRAATAVACLALALLGAALVPAGAGALDSDLKHSYAFRVEASNGYRILAIASSERADGLGEIVLFVLKKDHVGAIYEAPAVLSATRIDADLGALGKVALDVAPSGRRVMARGCDEGVGEHDYEPLVFSGGFEFHGEEGYTDAVSLPRDFSLLPLRLVCGTSFLGGGSGPNLPGAQLKLRLPAKRLSLQFDKNRPAGRTRLEANLHEERGEIRIQRFLTTYVGAGAFRYDPRLRTATIDPPAPFSGHGTFHRYAAPANRWRGDLTVDFPGRPDVALTGSPARISLVHARFEYR